MFACPLSPRRRWAPQRRMLRLGRRSRNTSRGSPAAPELVDPVTVASARGTGCGGMDCNCSAAGCTVGCAPGGTWALAGADCDFSGDGCAIGCASSGTCAVAGVLLLKRQLRPCTSPFSTFRFGCIRACESGTSEGWLGGGCRGGLRTGGCFAPRPCGLCDGDCCSTQCSIKRGIRTSCAGDCPTKWSSEHKRHSGAHRVTCCCVVDCSASGLVVANPCTNECWCKDCATHGCSVSRDGDRSWGTTDSD